MRDKSSPMWEKDESKKPLLDFTPDYGSVFGLSGKGKRKEHSLDEGRKSGISGLFRYASKSDKLILAVGLLFSVIHGAGFPILALVFGDMTNTLMKLAKFGFVKTNNVSQIIPEFSDNETDLFIAQDYATVTAANRSDSSVGTQGLTEDEFLIYMANFSFYYVYIGIGVLVASFIQTYCWELASERQIHRLRQIFFSQLLRQDVSWYDKNKQGDLNTKLSDDLERVREGIGSKFSMVTQYIATFVSGLSVGLYANWKLTLVILAVGPVLILTSAFAARTASTSAAREQLKYSIAGGVAEEVLTCLRTVVAFGGGQRETERYEKALDEGRILAMKRYYVISMGIFFVFFVMYGSYGLAFWYGSELIGSGISSPGSVFTVFFSVMVGAFSIGNSLPYINSVSTAIGAASTLFEVIDRVPPIDPYSDVGLVPDHMTGSIEFKNVVFSYPSRPEIKVLKSLTLNIFPSQTVAIVGSSGAGKSTIVSLLMRLYDPCEGQVLIDGNCLKTLNLKWLRQNIGLVSQEPVLFGVSIIENISYGRENVTKEEIIAAAKLANAHSFIENLPEGYNTLVGTRGAQLSGGQKQRIAIARALVRDPKILLLDEATSALDSESEGIVQAALENAMKGRTTIIVAHRLSTIRNADTIYAMKDGLIEEKGTHDELMDRKHLYYTLVTAQAMTMEEKEHQRKERLTDSNMKEVVSLSSDSVHSVTSNQVKNKMDSTSDVSMITLLKMNAPEWHWLLAGLVSCCVTGLIMPTFAFFYGEVFSTFMLTGEELKSRSLFWSIMFVVLGFVSGLSYWLQIVCMSTSAEKLVARLRFLALKSILRQPVSWFDQEDYSTGHLITRLARDAPLVKAAAGLRFGQVVASGMTLIAALSIAFVYGWKLALILLIAVPLLIGAAYHQTSIIRKTQKRDTELMDQAGRIASECVQNVTTVQSLGKEQLFHKLYCDYLLAPFRESKKQALVYGIVFALSQTVVYLMYAVAFRFGAYLISIHEMLPGEVYRVFFALSFCATSLGSSTAYLQDFTKAKYSAKIIFELITMKSDVDPMSGYGVKPVINGKITFTDVHFRYPARKDVSILNGINLTIMPGQTVALVGGSGCGKSTIVSLLERFYAPDKGLIMIDDVDIRLMNLTYLRNNIGLVIQEPVLFDCSIRENIAYGSISLGLSPTNQDIINAAKTANIHDFITSLPQGYETSCGERGTQLSGGQKQRIAIARALVRDPKILLLDEATSALDTESEKVVQAALDKARIGRTTIIVAHRLSTIQSADKIAVLHQGKIAEVGTHEKLKALKGIYFNLIKRQQL